MLTRRNEAKPCCNCGPERSGKSTLAASFAGPFINADIIQRDELQDRSMEASYRAAEIANKRPAELLDAKRSFVTETVFSHSSKLRIIADARTRGYMVIVMHVSVDDSALSVARVHARVMEGGHDVPEEKVRNRYVRGQVLIRQAVLQADRGMVFDNSRLNEPPQLMLLFALGRLLQAEPMLPQWVLIGYADDLWQ